MIPQRLPSPSMTIRYHAYSLVISQGMISVTRKQEAMRRETTKYSRFSLKYAYLYHFIDAIEFSFGFFPFFIYFCFNYKSTSRFRNISQMPYCAYMYVIYIIISRLIQIVKGRLWLLLLFFFFAIRLIKNCYTAYKYAHTHIVYIFAVLLH